VVFDVDKSSGLQTNWYNLLSLIHVVSKLTEGNRRYNGICPANTLHEQAGNCGREAQLIETSETESNSCRRKAFNLTINATLL
jgi:hypothetical protein